MSDRIAVMNQGLIEQLGSPREVNEHPETSFVAAVRPERVRIRPSTNGAPPDGQSLVRGTVALIVYLGTLTQFHVDTSLGRRMVAHRLSDQATTGVREGDAVVLTWEGDDALVLSGG